MKTLSAQKNALEIENYVFIFHNQFCVILPIPSSPLDVKTVMEYTLS